MAKGKVTSSFFIGLFILIGLIAIVGSIIWLGSSQFMKERKFYVTYIDGSVQGLEQGSAVKYQGVPIGNIKKIDIAPDGRLIEIIMAIDPKIKMTPYTRISPEMSGIAGGKYLLLFEANPNDTLVFNNFPELPFKPKYPVIPSAPSTISEFTLAARDILSKIQTIQFSQISKELTMTLHSTNVLLNNPDIKLSLQNLRKTTESVALLVSQLDTTKAIDNIITTTYKINKSSDDLNNTIIDLEKKINDLQIAEFMDKVYNDYDTTLNVINSSVKKISVRSDIFFVNLSSLLEDLKKTNAELQNTLRAFSDDPSTILLSNPPKKKN
ncbi:MAG TPA: MlaD family protein [Candidatus Kapabacteria bacterium]|nr:MlaD family protein [Candidatus Kapabacteria bacterium]